ncbi:uncharacterized protein LOC118275348 [Spodoptera frugiperda]|uniref:Uncharacterized protein LOC118275348 n=1 Tax=Spodoptera frugiperda TaxID=7108 RepID=A0A9R0DXN3_SPOFR|nr:uncharacterized protein LOC118275348 [Spodoptera frugiperda]
MCDYKVLTKDDRQTMYRATGGCVRFKMRTTGTSAEIKLIAYQDFNLGLYKITIGEPTKVTSLLDNNEQSFPSGIENFTEYHEFCVTWHSNKVTISLLGQEPFVKFNDLYNRPVVGYILYKTQSTPEHPVDWIIEISPVSLKPIGEKLFPGERLRWASMVDGVLPPDAMVGGFESEPTYIARAEHNNSICPGKYVPSRRRAFVPWGHMEHPKENFQILCGFNAKWMKTRADHIPRNAFVAGFSEVDNEPLYIGRAMLGCNLVPGKVHVLYKLCYLPFYGQEIEVDIYEILVTPGEESEFPIPRHPPRVMF